jgi:farnesyl diphosphate synthase
MTFSVDIHAKAIQPPRSSAALPIEAGSLLNAKDQVARMMVVYQVIQNYLLDNAERTSALDANRRRYLQKMMDVTCTGGKYYRGVLVVEVVDQVTAAAGVDAATRERALFEACVAGWMIEFMQAHFLVEDDIMDSSITRRGKPCWYRHPGVTVQCAINDGLIVLAWATEMAVHFLGDRPYLLALLRDFHDVDRQTTYGQLYDVSSMYDSHLLDPDVKQPTTTDYKEFTIAHYRRIVVHKTAFYTFYLPFVLGYHVSSSYVSYNVDLNLVRDASILLGTYFQIQDDVLDCFADPEVLGKIGTDIADCKCSWLAVTFLDTASEEKVAAFKAHYGKHNSKEDEDIIKALYNEAQMLQKYEVFEEESAAEVNRIVALLAKQSVPFSKAMNAIFQRMYKRKF